LCVGVDDQPRLAVDVAHEAGNLAAVRLIGLDQATAELGLENPRQDQHRRVERRPAWSAGSGAPLMKSSTAFVSVIEALKTTRSCGSRTSQNGR
jgi:hypothetical protein